MANDQIDYAEVRRKVERGLKVQKRNARIGFFIANLIMFVTFTLITWGFALTRGDSSLTGDKNIWLLLLPTIGWGTGVFMQFMLLLMDAGVMDKSMRERLVMREMGEELLGKGWDEADELEKPKRQSARSTAKEVAMRLSDDGELAPIEEEPLKKSTDRGRTS